MRNRGPRCRLQRCVEKFWRGRLLFYSWHSPPAPASASGMDARLRRACIAPVRSSTTEELNVGVASPDKADKLRRKFQAAKVEAVDWTALSR